MDKSRLQASFCFLVFFGLSVQCLLTSAQESHAPRTEEELIQRLSQIDTSDLKSTTLLAENPRLVTPNLWQQLMTLAAREYYQNSERAMVLYDLSRQVALQLNDQKLLAKTYYNLARSYSGLGNYERSKEAYRQSQNAFTKAGLPRDVIYILADLAIISFIQERYEEARTFAEGSLNLANDLKNSSAPPGDWPDAFGASGSLRILAELSAREGNFEEAIAQLERALDLLNKIGGTGDFGYYVTETYATLGRVYTSAGDHVKALRSLFIALQNARGIHLPNIINSIGYLYLEQEEYAKAKAQFERSLKLYQSEQNLSEEATVLLNLAVIEQRQGNHDEALKLFNQSLKAATATEFIDVRIASGEGLGVVLTAQRRFDGALRTLNESLSLAVAQKDKTRQTELLWRTAQAYFEMEDYVRAATTAEDAVKLARAAHLPKLTYLTLATLGEIYAAQSKIEPAIETLLESIKELESMRNQVVGGEQSLQLFFENKVAPYHGLVDLFIKQGKFAEALSYAERAKSRVLLDVVGGNKAELTKVLSDIEKTEAQRLLRKISLINDFIRSEQNSHPSNLAPLYAQLDSARIEFQSFQDRMYVAHPELRLRSGKVEALRLSSIRTYVEEGAVAYLEYVISDKKVGLFLLKRNESTGGTDIHYFELPINPQDLERKVNLFHDRLAQRHPGHAESGRELYSVLFAPVAQKLQNVKTICIVSDAFLWNLPFQALTTSSNHYLLEDFSIQYAPSLSVLREMNNARSAKKEASSSLIAFGNPVIGRDEKLNEELCPLPEAEKEVAAVASALKWSERKLFVGREATEKTFKSLASEFGTVHFATHGILDDRDPLYSHLLLTKTDGDIENDGQLQAREIMDMRLHADLAVLSACETGNGKISPGEGVIGMSWAFFVAGARSMVVSQWRVNSTSTSQLMVNFYQALARQRNSAHKSEALRQASLQLLKDPRYRHPFYWAGFVLVGRN